MPIAGSIGAPTSQGIAQMLFADAQARQQSSRQFQFAALQEKGRKFDVLMAAIAQHQQRRQAERAARGPSRPSRIAEQLIGDTPLGAFFETEKWGQRPVPAGRSLGSALTRGLGGVGGLPGGGVGGGGGGMASAFTDVPLLANPFPLGTAQGTGSLSLQPSFADF